MDDDAYTKFEVNFKVKRNMRIGELAEKSGLAASAIRYYERQGLLPAPLRADNGYRHYPSSAVERLRLIRLSQKLGFTLEVIRGLFSETGECSYTQTFAEVNVRLEEVERLQATLAEQHQNLLDLRALLSHRIETGETLPCTSSQAQ
ncbi:MerR family transcriptional regulator [Roseateles chitinivorans]|uniref:MerR family transcriptional regulator n=1 Tax=Roseateles chitinivorans TaxID=2917965 RepID=UPI003D675233